MENKELRESLEKLHIQLQNTENLDENSREVLEQLANDIQNALDRNRISEEEHKKLTENLKKSSRHFEASYPDLTESMNIVIHTLSNMGI